MSTLVETLKKGLNYILPRTVLKAIADKNQQYLSNDLLASDLNALKDGEVSKLEGNFAPIEVSPSLHAYSVGSLLVYNGVLYTVTSAISVGSVLTVGTNLQSKSVADSLSDINTLLGIESSSFSGDHKYIRYNNGLQICWGYGSMTVGSWGTWGNLYETGSNIDITYAQPFIEKPALSLTPRGYDYTFVENPPEAYQTTTGVEKIYLLRSKAGETGATYSVTYIAIGKWK